MDRKSLDEILNSEPTHEAEDTLDNQPEPDEASAEPEKVEVEPVKAEAAKTDAPDEGNPDDGEADDGEDAKTGLPPWMHKRLKVKDDKIRTVEQERDQFKQELERLKAAQQQQPQIQPQPQAQPQHMDEHTRKLNASIAYAEKQFGVDEVQQALQWAYRKSEQDPAFNELAMFQPMPAQFAVQEFQKSPEYKQFQAMKELSEYGYDMDAFFAAKMAQSQAHAGMVAAGPQSGEHTPRQQTAMPTDLQKVGTGGPRGRGYTGPTPLSELLPKD